MGETLLHQLLRKAVLFIILSIPTVSLAASVQLEWDYIQGATLATNFIINRSDNCSGIFIPLAVITVPTQTYTDSAIVVGQTFCYYVTAQSVTGEESVPSNTVTFQVPQAPTSPYNLQGTVRQ